MRSQAGAWRNTALLIFSLAHGCADAGGGRGSDQDRGTWQPGAGGKSDELATCTGVCGDMAPAGCWCDQACLDWHDCCIDFRDLCLGVDDDGGEGEDTTGGDGVDASDDGTQPPPDTPPPPEGELCFLGAARDFGTCIPLVSASEAGYDYPSPLGGDANYRAPVQMIDLQAVDPDTVLAPDFVLSELAQAYKGRYAVVQPHAVTKLQSLRDALGEITVNSGYRSPGYNASVDGATHSRHMFGDGFDIVPQDTALGTLESACGELGGMLVEYSSHVHCDWRFDPVDTALFGAAATNAELPATFSDPYSADIVEIGSGVLRATYEGFDEGTPSLRWEARDASGDLVDTAAGETYAVPAEAAVVQLLVGKRVAVSWTR